MNHDGGSSSQWMIMVDDGKEGLFTWFAYDQVTNYLDMVIFFLKKILWGPRRPKIRDFGYHGP